jgi:CheY-like chemotaxis protein
MALLQSWLERKKYEVKFTSSRQEVPLIIRDFKPGIVVADILQNNVIEDLRDDEHTKNIPILLMSGYTKGQENYQLKIDDVIEKPFNLSLLEKKIARLFKKAG